MRVRVLTIGHGTRPADELVDCLREGGAETLVDVRRYPQSRRNPQFNQAAIAASARAAGIGYVHAVEFGGRRTAEPGEDRFGCVRVPAFRSYIARMGTEPWQAALAETLTEPSPCFMCAETPWQRCHRRWIAELLAARGHEVVHLVRPGIEESHRLFGESEVRGDRLYVCGSVVA
jgi:uncharacterized protein (DUF488 family)